jgi:PadR family transcriptional regulator, regulatory protein PadR
VKLSHTSALILETIATERRYGFDIMDVTGLPSGTVYPALRRLEVQKLIDSRWEAQKSASAGQRPARKYYKLTRAGNAALTYARERYPLLRRLTASDKLSRVVPA